MKKIYLLSAVACMFAFTANAQDFVWPDKAKGNYGYNEWWTDGGASSDLEEVDQISGTALGGKVAKVVVPKAGNDWDVEFCNILRGNKGQEVGATFTFDCEIFWTSAGASDTAEIHLLTGKIGDTGHADWQWDAEANTELVADGGFWSVHNVAKKIAKEEWTKVSWGDGITLGEIGGTQAVCIQINLDNNAGTNLGAFYFRNIVIKMGKKTTLEYYTIAGETAVDEVAAVNAFVAGDVLYASEAADVVVYNISGVAVKAAKNVASLSVADLKAGLYVAKVGNKTIKFVK
jgi:hypothetical protein